MEKKAENLRIDKKDMKILSILQKNSRTPFLEIARELGISGATVHERIRNLTRMGIIEGFSTNINYKKLGYGVKAVVNVVLEHPSFDLNKLKEALNDIPEVTEAHNLTGDTDLLLMITAKDIDDLRTLLTEKIQNMAGIQRLSTNVILDSPVFRQGVRINP